MFLKTNLRFTKTSPTLIIYIYLKTRVYKTCQPNYGYIGPNPNYVYTRWAKPIFLQLGA